METYIDKCKLKLNKYIENIEQLGADARYYNDYDNYDQLRVLFKSTEYWSKKATKVVEGIQRKIKKGDINEKE